MLRSLSLTALGLTLCGAPLEAQGSDAYYVEYISGNLTRFSLGSPGTQTIIGPSINFIVGLEFGAAGVLFALRDSGDLMSIDLGSGATTPIGNISPVAGHIWTGLAYDETAGTMYASSTTGNSASAIYTVDTTAGTAALVGGSLEAEAIVDIGFDAGGNMYGHDLDGNDMNAINKVTGAMARIGPTGFIGTGPWHGMDWDAASATMYLYAHNGISNDNELRPVNLATGAAPSVGSLNLPSGSLAIQGETGPLIYCTAKTSSAGCVTSVSTSAPGQPVSGAGGYSVLATNVHSFKNGILFGSNSGAAALPFSGGVLCMNPPLKRGPLAGSTGMGANTCTGSYSTEVNDGLVIPAGLDAGLGNSAWYQYWYRDFANGAGQLGTALSNAVQLDFK